MKTQSDFLFRLIKSLTPTEKRYFKLYASRHVMGEKNKYLRLFEIMEQQMNYDEGKARAALEEVEGTATQYFSAAKNRLKEIVLNALDDYERGNLPQEQLKKQLHQVRLLTLKGFKKEALQLLEKVKKRAILSDSLEIALLALKLKVPIVGLANIDLKSHSAEEKHYAHLIQHQAEYNYLHYQSYKLLQKRFALDLGEERREFDEIMQHPLLENAKQALTFRSKIQFYDIKQLYYKKIVKDLKRSYTYQKAYLRLFDESPERLKWNFLTYYHIVLNFFSTCVELGKYQEVREGLVNLKNTAKRHGHGKSSGFKKDYFLHKYALLMGMCHAECQIEEGLSLIPEIIEGLEIHEPLLKLNSRVQLYRHIAFFYFLGSYYSESLTWLNKILELKLDVVAQQVGSFARIHQVLIHYELGNTNFVLNLMHTYLRHSKKKDSPFQSELILLKGINRLAKVVDKERKRTLLHRLKRDLEVFKEDPAEKPVLGYAVYFQWIEAQLSGRALREVLEEELSVVHGHSDGKR